MDQRWRGMLGAFWSSSQLRHLLRGHQESINTIAYARDVGSWVGCCFGISYSRLGPRFMILTAAVLTFISHGLIWSIVTGSSKRWTRILLFFLAASSKIETYYACFLRVTCAFGTSQLGIMGGCFSLSGSTLAFFFHAICSKTTDYILLQGCLTTIVFCLAAFLLVVTMIRLLVPEVSHNHAVNIVVSVILACILIFLPLYIVLGSDTTSTLEGSLGKCGHADGSTIGCMWSRTCSCHARKSWTDWYSLGLHGGKNHQLHLLLEHLDLHGKSLRCIPFHQHRVPRPVFMCIGTLVATLGHLVVAFGLTSFPLFLACVLEGFSHGLLVNTFGTIIVDLFGRNNFSVLMGIGSIAILGGTYAVSVPLVGSFYDKEVPKHHRELVCHGVGCYRQSFIVLSGISVFAFVLSVVFTIRSRNFYKHKLQM